MGHVQLAIAVNPAVSILAMNLENPASGTAVNSVGRALPMASAVHLRLPGDVAKPRKLGDGRLLSAPTFAEATRVPDAPYNRRHAVASQETGVAAQDKPKVVIIADGRAPAASALTKAGRVGAARIVGVNGLATMRHAAVVALQVPRLFVELLAASAFASLCAARLNDPELSPACLDLVAVDESTPARQSTVGTICDLAASTLAKLAKIDLGHLIFSRDRWSAGTGVHALGQPFYCIVKEAA
jgi:hypothetical protein